MATMVNAEERNHYKRMMIEAELAGSTVKAKREASK